MTDHQNLLSATNGVLLPSYIWYRSSVPENSTNGSSAFGATTTTTTTTTGLEHMDSDELLVKEWNQLSLTEREHVEEEVHGVAIYQKEDNEAFVKESLEHLEDELHKLRKRRPSYDKAVFLNPSYVKSRDFRLLFLRSEYFDTKKAAERLVGHFDLKLQLFGLDKLSRDIKLEDLPEEAVAALNCGAIQILPGKDRTGRSIICVANKYQNYNSCSLAEVSKSHQVYDNTLIALTFLTRKITLSAIKVANGFLSVYGGFRRRRITKKRSCAFGL